MEFEAAADDASVRTRVRVGVRYLLEVVDVFDLRVRTEPVVVPAKIGLAVCEEDRLVMGSPEHRHGEIPPLREEQRRDKDEDRDRDIALDPPVLDEPSDRAPVCEAELVQRDGLGLAVGLAVVAEGATVAVGI